MYSGEEILKELKAGNIVIEPFNEKQINPNSYNITLSNELYVYEADILDCKKENKIRRIEIPEDGYILAPGILYITKTREYTESYNCIPMISGRSSVGRVGITTHLAAGLGEVGFKGRWNLGITCLVPTKVYSGMELGQIFFYSIVGDSNIKYSGKYNNNSEVAKSKLYEEFD